jgi:hypothetical protein
VRLIIKEREENKVLYTRWKNGWMCILFCVKYLGEAKETRGFWDFVIRREREERRRDIMVQII